MANELTPSDQILHIFFEYVAQAVAERIEKKLEGYFKSQPKPRPALLDRQDMARELGVSPATLDRLRSKGMPCFRIGDAPRFRLSEVLTWLEPFGSGARHFRLLLRLDRTQARFFEEPGSSTAAPHAATDSVAAESTIEKVREVLRRNKGVRGIEAICRAAGIGKPKVRRALRVLGAVNAGTVRRPRFFLAEDVPVQSTKEKKS